MALLSKEAIIAADDLEKVTVYIEKWGGDVKVRSMTAKERDEFENVAAKEFKGVESVRAYFLSKVIEGPDGELMFDSPEGIKALAQKSASILDKLMESAKKLNGIGQKEVEELAKNSEQTPLEGSASA